MLREALADWPAVVGKPSRPVVAALTIGLIGAVGILDFVTGWEVHFSIFYLAPVCLATWSLGRRFGVLVAVLSTAAGSFAVASQPNHWFSHPAIPYWNAAVRLGLLLLAVFAVAALKRALVYAGTDPVTGLPNARAFRAAAEAEMARARRYGRPFTIAYLDIDGFKRVNDERGHARGDQVLRAVGLALRSSLRASDLAARLGGDEFAMFLPEAGLEAAGRTLEKVHAALAACVRGYSPEIGFSIGAATFSVPPASVLVALEKADELMYAAKRSAGSPIRHEALPPHLNRAQPPSRGVARAYELPEHEIGGVGAHEMFGSGETTAWPRAT